MAPKVIDHFSLQSSADSRFVQADVVFCPACVDWLAGRYWMLTQWIAVRVTNWIEHQWHYGHWHNGHFLRRRLATMITVGMNYQVIEGKQNDFEAKFAAVITALNAADGHQTSTLWKDVSNGASYLITSEWSDEKAFASFIQSTEFREVTNWGKEQILAGRPQHKVYKS